MAATLTLVFRTRLRLLPLGLALAAAALTFGALSLAGGSLTMASIAVLPVLIGLAVDYAIQFQARFDEQRSGGAGPRAADERAAAWRTPWPRPRPAAPRSSRPARPRRWGSWCCCSRRSRWCAASACCSCWASRSRWPAPRGRLRGAGAVRRRPPRAESPLAACASGWPRLAPTRVWRPHASGWPDRCLASRSACSLARPRRVLAVGLAVAVLGLGARHPERGGVRRPAARAPGPPGAARRGRAPGRHRRVGRDRRGGAGGRHHPARRCCAG